MNEHREEEFGAPSPAGGVPADGDEGGDHMTTDGGHSG